MNPSTRNVCLLAVLAMTGLHGVGSAASDAADGDVLLTPPLVILATQKPPVFPPAALAGRFSGTVTVEALVSIEGAVSDVKVLSCSRPNLGFEEAAREAVMQWRFEPAMVAERPVEQAVTFRLNFRGSGPGGRNEPRVSAGAVAPGSERTGQAPRGGEPPGRSPAAGTPSTGGGGSVPR
jgi:TonB family protein